MNTCQHCGKPIGSEAVQGLCPACLMQAGLGSVAGSAPGVAFELPTLEELQRRFPQLEIIELIGRGGMGAVYKARQPQLDRIVALKLLPPGIGADPSFAERFAQEARALARLNHPNIVTIHDSGQSNGLFYFLMEFVDGMNLRALQAAGRVAPREALAIVPQICDALQYAHDHGIVHRDIKPENILIDRRGRVKVADFGLAKLMRAAADKADLPTGIAGGAISAFGLTETGKVIGTPDYMAPEQLERPGEVDHRADIYALGVVFYQMLTGELPGRWAEPPSRKIKLDVRLDEVVMRAMEILPERRYQQASEVKTRIETIAGDPKSAQTSQHHAQNGSAVSDARALGLFSFALFFAGTLGALVLFALVAPYNQGVVLIFSAVALVFAFGFAIPSRRDPFGKLVFRIIAGTLILIVGIGAPLFFLLHLWRMKASEEARSEVMQRIYQGTEELRVQTEVASRNLRSIQFDPQSLPPLLKSAYQGEEESVMNLLAKGADLKTAGPHGWTVLHMAGLGGHMQLSQHLLAKGADRLARDDQGHTPADLATLMGHDGTAKILNAK